MEVNAGSSRNCFPLPSGKDVEGVPAASASRTSDSPRSRDRSPIHFEQPTGSFTASCTFVRASYESGSFAVFTIDQVCERLGISRSLCYREIRSGNLRAHRFARRTYRVSPEDLADYIARSVEPTPAPKAVAITRRRPKREQGAFKHIEISQWLSSQS